MRRGASFSGNTDNDTDDFSSDCSKTQEIEHKTETIMWTIKEYHKHETTQTTFTNSQQQRILVTVV